MEELLEQEAAPNFGDVHTSTQKSDIRGVNYELSELLLGLQTNLRILTCDKWSESSFGININSQ